MSLESDFANPPFHLNSRPLWFWNGRLERETILAQLEQARASGYAGVGILPAKGMHPEFMSPAFLALYKAAADKARELGLKLCLYDEYWFPSGAANGRLAAKYPDALWKRLDMVAADVEGPTRVRLEMPKGIPMGAAAMNTATHERLNLSAELRDGVLDWKVPAGPWKVMLFVCSQEIRGLCAPYPDHIIPGGLVDYLDPEAVEKFIEVTYQAYYDTFPEHFGTTIDSAFYDEPTCWYRLDGRGWTPRYNEKFIAKHGIDPITLYPALWFDIGPETAAVRNLLFGFRAELYATGFPKVITEWCHKHGIQLTGHLDREEAINPVGHAGDLMKALKYQDIPGVDEIGYFGWASRAYKVVSSAAYNYDRPLVMSETYGAMTNMPLNILYKEAMDQAAKGVNLFVPHAIWYDKANVIFQPELSDEHPLYGPELPAYNRTIARLHRLLQGGRHVADIGVLYPIATLQSGYSFQPHDHYLGEPAPPEADYMQLGEILSLQLRRDYTFLHPEVLAENCVVEDASLFLSNKTNWERFRVLILPGSKTISVSVLQKVKEFYERGGRVISTTCLPEFAAEPGRSADVQKLIAELFGQGEGMRENSRGGRAAFLGKLSPESLQRVLEEMLPVPDVRLDAPPQPTGGNVSYIHKVLDGHEIFFFANSSDEPLSTAVYLRGKFSLQAWDPVTGKISAIDVTHEKKDGQDITTLQLSLTPVQSLFVVAA